MKRTGLVVLLTLSLAGSSIFAETFIDRANGDEVDAPISAFTATSIDTLTLGLQWRATNAQTYWDIVRDFYDGPADRYELRYSTTNPGSSFVFNSMTPATVTLPVPEASGTLQQCTVTGLTQGTSYWFVMRTWYYAAFDDSAVLPVTTITDVTLPATISTLAVASTSENSVALNWTASGDDNGVATAARTELRYSTAGPILTSAAFDAATPVTFMPEPLAGGASQAKVVDGLAPSTTYWFSIRAVDEVENKGAFSTNNVTATTLTPEPGSSGKGGGCAGSTAGSGSLGLPVAVLFLLVSALGVANRQRKIAHPIR